eukprot:SAG11_NODE_2077_length_3856_cov_2.082246_2_plen_201_part_00
MYRRPTHTMDPEQHRKQLRWRRRVERRVWRIHVQEEAIFRGAARGRTEAGLHAPAHHDMPLDALNASTDSGALLTLSSRELRLPQSAVVRNQQVRHPQPASGLGVGAHMAPAAVALSVLGAQPGWGFGGCHRSGPSGDTAYCHRVVGRPDRARLVHRTLVPLCECLHVNGRLESGRSVGVAHRDAFEDRHIRRERRRRAQ